MTDNGVGDEDPDVGEVCVSGLALGDYTVDEVTPPPGYGDAAQTDLTVTVVDDTNCTDSQPTGAGAVTFTNAPLGDIQVNFRDGGSGEISATSITCDNTGTTADTTPATGWDASATRGPVESDGKRPHGGRRGRPPSCSDGARFGAACRCTGKRT